MASEQTNSVAPFQNIDLASTFAPPPLHVGSAADDAGDILGSIAHGGVTDDRQPEFGGRGTPGDTIVIRDNGTEIGTTEVDEHGAWTFTPSTDLLEGQHAITIVTRDESGNESPPSPAFNFEIDVTPPDASRLNVSGFTDNVGGVTGNVISGGTTDETRPLLSGISNGTPGHTVTVMVKDATGTHELGLATIGENGQWTFQVDTPLAAGLNTFMLVERDAAGNETMPTGRYKVTVNTDKPNAPVIDSVLDDVGEPHMLRQGEATNDARPALAGTAQANHTVKFYDGATYLGQTVADESGKWSFTPRTNLTDGAHGITATSTSPVGQTSDASDAWNFVVDTTPPTQTATVTDIGKDSGFDVDDYLTNDGGAGRLLQGKLSAALGAGETLQVSSDGGQTWKAAFVFGDRWSAQDDNSHTDSWTVQTRVVDEAGNAGPAQSQAMTLDTVAPAAPIQMALVNGGVEVRFDAASVAVGHKLSLMLRGDHFDYALTAADIAAGKVFISDPGSFSKINFEGISTSAVEKNRTFGELTITSATGTIGADFYGEYASSLGVSGRALLIGSGQNGDSTKFKFSSQKEYVSFTFAGTTVAEALFYDASEKLIGRVEIDLLSSNIRNKKVSFEAPAGAKISHFVIRIITDVDYHHVLDDIQSGSVPLNESNISAAIVDPAGNVSQYTSSRLQGKDSFDNLSKINAGASHTTTAGVKIEMIQGFVEPSNYSSLYLSSQGIASFKIPAPAKSVEIEYGNTHGAPYGKVEFYSAEGVLLGTKNMVAHPDSSAGMAKIGFSSNTPISYIKVYGQDSGTAPGVNDAILIGDLSWSGVDTGSNPAQRQTLTEGSVGTLHGGSDNNEFVVTDVKHLADSAISGNGGTDTLKLTGSNQTLDLTALAGKVSSVEIIDLTGSGNNTLKLSLADVMENGAMNQFMENGRVQMVVKGNAGDAVTLSDVLPNGTDAGDWVKQANISVWGVVYEVYQHSGFKADLLVQQGVTVTLQNAGAGTFHIEPELEAYVLDHATMTWTDSDDTLIARLGYADRLEGGAGNDTFTKVGTGDTVHGGAGDDTVRINSGDFAHLDGGLGIDTLVMDGKAMHIDLSALGAKVQGFEKFDLGAGGNTLALHASDVLAGGARDMVVADGKVQMLVNGANGDVNLLGGDDSWTQGGNATVGGVTYSVYTNLAGTAELLVEDKVHVTIL
ncbi:Ig-like domain-containing protein [Variovorax boronicumulans]|uniref:Ig-like domain-containing protein n=1 Tax=Variovorax boronicumulans TaxID=436515 RepID=UPI0012E404CB|nr:Ig-like domain-containing protein [Variovorax boronicumulans]GER09893.1 Ig-like domain repeat protein [Variovorax boronicumulans]